MSVGRTLLSDAVGVGVDWAGGQNKFQRQNQHQHRRTRVFDLQHADEGLA